MDEIDKHALHLIAYTTQSNLKKEDIELDVKLDFDSSIQDTSNLEPVGTIRVFPSFLLPEHHGHDSSLSEIIFMVGRMAVMIPHRKLSMGTVLLNAAEKAIMTKYWTFANLKTHEFQLDTNNVQYNKMPSIRFLLHSQVSARLFYEKNGYSAVLNEKVTRK